MCANLCLHSLYTNSKAASEGGKCFLSPAAFYGTKSKRKMRAKESKRSEAGDAERKEQGASLVTGPAFKLMQSTLKHIARAGGDIAVTYSQIYRKYIFQHREKETARHRQGQRRQDTHAHTHTDTDTGKTFGQSVRQSENKIRIEFRRQYANI